MQTFSFLFVTFLFAYSEAYPQSQSKECSMEHHRHMHTCMGKDLKMPQGFNETMKICREKVFGSMDMTKPMKEFEPKKLLCMVACQAEEYDLIDESGKFQIDEIQRFIEEAMPKEAVAPLMDRAKMCIKEFGAAGVKPGMSDCNSNEPVFHCFKKAILNVCMPHLSTAAPMEKKE